MRTKSLFFYFVFGWEVESGFSCGFLLANVKLKGTFKQEFTEILLLKSSFSWLKCVYVCAIFPVCFLSVNLLPRTRKTQDRMDFINIEKHSLTHFISSLAFIFVLYESGCSPIASSSCWWWDHCWKIQKVKLYSKILKRYIFNVFISLHIKT